MPLRAPFEWNTNETLEHTAEHETWQPLTPRSWIPWAASYRWPFDFGHVEANPALTTGVSTPEEELNRFMPEALSPTFAGMGLTTPPSPIGNELSSHSPLQELATANATEWCPASPCARLGESNLSASLRLRLLEVERQQRAERKKENGVVPAKTKTKSPPVQEEQGIQ